MPAAVLAGIPAQLVRRRPDIRQAERELEAANVDVAVAKAEFLPSLNLTPYIGLNAFRPSVLLNPASVVAGVLGSLAAPVFNRRLLKGNLAISQAQSREAYFAYQRAILTGVSEVVGSLKGLENYRGVADLQTQEVAAHQYQTGAVSIAGRSISGTGWRLGIAVKRIAERLNRISTSIWQNP